VDGRRRLAFADLDGVMPAVDRLLAGHDTVGTWSLGQICSHLAAAFHLSVDGVPPAAPQAFRRTAGVAIRWVVLYRGRIPAGVRVPAAGLVPGPQPDARTEADALRRAIGRFRASPGPFAEHPLLGRMTAAQWGRFHLIHCAHHLSFVVPT
jgi:hypothetical protein